MESSETSLTRHLADETHTLALGEALGESLVSGLVVFLIGVLGAGKTTFARGALRGLGYRGRVKSPSYTLVELYELSRLYLYHFDFYRLDNPRGWIDAGFRDYFGTHAVCLVEWPEKAEGTLPAPDLEVRLTLANDGRDVQLLALTRGGRRCLRALKARMKAP